MIELMIDTEAVDIPADEVRAEVDRILSSRGFATAGRLSRLLRYIVEKTLANETDQLKEYAVGVEVFERPEDYDPRLDSIVRVEAGRLRSRLDEYYIGEGGASPIRIIIPRGGYSAQFERRNGTPPATSNGAAASPASPAGVRWWRTAVLAAGLLGVVAAMVVWLGASNPAPPPDTRPSMAVLAFESHMAGADNERFASRITEAVTSELARLGTMSVVSHTSAMQFKGEKRSIREIASALNAGFVLEGSIDDEGSGVLVVVRLVDATRDRKIWVSDFRGDRADVRGIAMRIAVEASTAALRAATR
jgi:TolB-like protein